jgi:hypothetical protein
MRRGTFPGEVPIVDPPTHAILDKMFEEIKRSEPKKIKIQGFPLQDIPDDITCQRRLLQDFYTAWKKHKFGPSEESGDAGTSAAATDLKMPTPIKTGLANCEKLIAASDNVTSSFSQLSSGFLLFATAYPKHAPTCYKMAEFCFKMANIASQTLFASWKLTHGVTLSSMETAIGELDSILTDLTPMFLKVYLQFENVYSEYVNYVTTEKAFERDEEFQIEYKQPPMESQLSTFLSVTHPDLKMVMNIAGQMRRIVHRISDPPEQKVSKDGSSEQKMEVEESDQPHTLEHVREIVSTLEEDVEAMCHHLSCIRVPGS